MQTAPERYTMSNPAKILIVEDEEHVVSFIRKGLSEEGFEVTVALDGRTGLELFKQNMFDLVILDIMLPGINGYELCREMKDLRVSTPILFLTALGTPENVVLGLNTGADDYLVKPFKFIELVARINSLLRRTTNLGGQNLNEKENLRYRIATLEVDDYNKTVTLEGKNITLTATEYRLLLYFMKNKGRVVSRAQILDEVWGVNYDMGTNVVDVYVNYLRKKTDNSGNGKLIHTVVGMGYVLKEPLN